jgi:hypothetical protein
VLRYRPLDVCGVVLPLLAGLLAAPSVFAQSPQGVIDCTPSGYGANCQVPLRPGQTEATVNFKPSPPVLGTTELRYQTLVLPGSKEQARPAPAHPSQPDHFVYRWSGTGSETDTIRVMVQTQIPSALLTDTIYLIPSKGPTYHVRIPEYYPYVWLRDTWLPITIRAELQPEPGTPAITKEACERTRFAYQPRAGGTVQPDTGSALWYASGDGSGGCFVEARWKLGDATGDQQLRLTVGDNERVARTEQILTAYGREGPRVVAGIGIFTRHHSKRSLYCPRPDTPEVECASLRFEEDTLKRDFPVRNNNAWETFFGVELPLFLPNQTRNKATTFLSRRTRLLVGSTFDEPTKNVFVGLTIIPLFMPAYERIPVQVQAGWRPTEGGFFAGGSVDGSALISNAFKALGVL